MHHVLLLLLHGLLLSKLGRVGCLEEKRVLSIHHAQILIHAIECTWTRRHREVNRLHSQIGSSIVWITVFLISDAIFDATLRRVDRELSS